MGYFFFANFVYSNLNSIFNILNVIMTQYRFFANNSLRFESEPCNFLKIFLRFSEDF